MKIYLKIIIYQLRDILRSKWLIIYSLFFLLLTEGLFWLDGSSTKVLLSLTNVILIIIPLVSVTFAMMYYYNSREYIEMMLAQPVKRSALFAGLYSGLSLPLIFAFLTGMLMPFVINGVEDSSQYPLILTLTVSGILLTFLFTAIAFLISIIFDDKIKGFGLNIFAWLFFSVLFDGWLLALTYIFSDYPLEKPLIGAIMLNPIGLARIFITLQFDVAALMGYTGAVFQSFFGSLFGALLSATALLVWTGTPFLMGMRRFGRKDF